jgi:hypothetical protein
MRTVVRALVLGAGLAVWWTGSGLAQERTVDEVLRGINQMLQENSYYDHGGKHAVSQLSLRRGGTLVIRVTKTDENSEVTNIYETNIRTINLEHIQAHHRGDHTVLMIGCQGDVATKLKSVQRSGNITEWDLPARGSLALEFRSGDTLARDITESIKQLITLAREDPRYAAE